MTQTIEEQERVAWLSRAWPDEGFGPSVGADELLARLIQEREELRAENEQLRSVFDRMLKTLDNKPVFSGMRLQKEGVLTRIRLMGQDEQLNGRLLAQSPTEGWYDCDVTSYESEANG